TRLLLQPLSRSFIPQLEIGRNRARFRCAAWRASMTTIVLNRRNLLVTGGSVLATGISGLVLPAHAQGLAPTASMSGGANNYQKGAAIVDRIGKGGFWMSGTVRR